MTSPDEIQTIGDLMTGDLIALRPADSVARARQTITDSGLHALPIIDDPDGGTIGVVTLADIQGRFGADLLGDVITRPAVTVSSDTSVATAAGLMRAEMIHHLLITDESKHSAEVIGIVSSFDLLKMITA